MSTKFKFTKCFNVTYSANWSNTAKSIELFEQILVPYLNDVEETLNYPKEQTNIINYHGHVQRTWQQSNSGFI